jgi:hypothetical protein
MRVDRRLTGSPGSHFDRRVQRFHFLDSGLPYGIAGRGLFRRRIYDEIPLYQGSQWWALTRPCVSHVLGFVQENPRYVRFLRYTLMPDEVFFQSIVKSSPFGDRISHDLPRSGPPSPAERHDHGTTYLDWNIAGAAHPKILSLADFGALARSHCIFARKFDEALSTDLLDLLCRMYFPGSRVEGAKSA